MSVCCNLWQRPVNHRERPRLSPYESWDRLQKTDGWSWLKSVVPLTRSEISAETEMPFLFLNCEFKFLEKQVLAGFFFFFFKSRFSSLLNHCCMPGYINMKMYVLWVIKKHFWLFLSPRSDEINVKMNNKSDPRAVSLNLNSPWCCLAEFTMCLTWTDLDKETPDSSSMLCQLMSSLKSRTGLSSWTSLLTLWINAFLLTQNDFSVQWGNFWALYIHLSQSQRYMLSDAHLTEMPP